MAIRAVGYRWRGQMIMGAPGARTPLGMSSLGIWHSCSFSGSAHGRLFRVILLGILLFFRPVLLQTCQRRHARVHGMGFTAAFFLIQIHAAVGA